MTRPRLLFRTLSSAFLLISWFVILFCSLNFVFHFLYSITYFGNYFYNFQWFLFCNYSFSIPSFSNACNIFSYLSRYWLKLNWFTFSSGTFSVYLFCSLWCWGTSSTVWLHGVCYTDEWDISVISSSVSLDKVHGLQVFPGGWQGEQLAFFYLPM